MAKFWNSVGKLILCVETYCCPIGRTKRFSKNTPSCWHKWRNRENLKKEPLFTVFSFCGFIGNREKSTKHDTVEEVLHNVALAAMALKDGNIKKSEKMFMETLDLAEMNNFSSTIISACDILSSLAMKLGDYEKAEDFLIKALNNLLSQGAPEDNNTVVNEKYKNRQEQIDAVSNLTLQISFNLKLSTLYSKNGNDSLAEVGFKNCIKLQENKIQHNTRDEDALLLWATILYWYGKFLVQKNRYTEAKSCFQESYRVTEKIERLSPGQVTVILYNLGEVCRLLGEHDDAIEHLLKGVSVAKKSKNPDLAYLYNKLGQISISKKLYKEAKVWCNVAQKFAVKNRNREAEIESKECLEKLNKFLVSCFV